MKKKLVLIIVLITLFFGSIVSVVSAVDPNPVAGGGGGSPVAGGGGGKTEITKKLDNPITADNLSILLTNIADLIIAIGTIIAVFMFLWIGFKFVMARGNATEIKEAQKWFLNAVIGTAILISAKVIVVVIQNTLTNSGIVNENLFKK